MSTTPEYAEADGGADPSTYELFLGSRSALSRQRLRGKAVRRETRDVYVDARVPTGLVLRCRALQLALPDAVVSHDTAAELLDLPWPRDHVVHLTRSPDAGTSERPGTRTHHTEWDDEDTVEVAGVRVKGPVRTLVDLAARRPRDLVALVCVADVVARRVGKDELIAAIAPVRRRRGLVALRQAVLLCEPGSGSPAESRARLRLHQAGFTGLVHGVVVRDELGGWLAEPDLADPAAKVAVQVDGAVHFVVDDDLSEEQKRTLLLSRRRKDVGRDEVCRQHGWEVVVLTADDERDPWRGNAKVRAAYERAGFPQR